VRDVCGEKKTGSGGYRLAWLTAVDQAQVLYLTNKRLVASKIVGLGWATRKGEVKCANRTGITVHVKSTEYSASPARRPKVFPRFQKKFTYILMQLHAIIFVN